MPDHHNKKHFLKLPKYTGGSEAFRDFIAENLQYPKDALESKVEGSVIIEYEITDEGLVNDPRVLKSLGYGCDEEAVRVIGMLRFEKVKNRGLRVRLTTKTTIHFRLPGVTITYSTPEKSEHKDRKTIPERQNTEPVKYEYTIEF